MILSAIAFLLLLFYAVLFFSFLRFWTEKEDESYPENFHPDVKVTVIVPFRNEEKSRYF